MNRALLYLFSHSLLNAVLVRIKRLRKPKYIIGALLGGGYIYLYFYKFLYTGAFQHAPRNQTPLHLAVTPDVAFNLAALGLLGLLLLLAWIIPAERTAIELTESEIAWLLPAPVSRSQLIHFKLLKSQLGLLAFAVLMTLVTGRLARDGHGVIHTMGWWIVLATFRLHRLGASFVLTRLMDRGLSTRLRRVIVVIVVLTLISVVVVWRQRAPSPPDLSSLFMGGQFGPYISELVSSGPAPVLLTPFRAIVRPWFAKDWGAFFVSFFPALLVIALHYWWVIRSAVSFEEASIRQSEKRAAWLAARKAGDLRMGGSRRARQEPVFALRPSGSPVIAFVWKAWIQAGGRRTLRLATMIILGLVVIAAIPSLTGHLRAAGYITGVVGFVAVCALLFGGPQATAQAVRRELQSADFLRTAPVAGSQIILGQMLGSSVIWTVIQWTGLLLAMLGGFVMNELPHEILSLLPAGLAGAGIALLPFNIVAALIPTGVMLLFPGWFRPGEMRGVEAMGLSLLMVFAQLLFLGCSLVVPALAAAGVGYVIQLVAPVWCSVIIGAIAAALVLSLEAWIGVITLGTVFEKFDPGSDQ